MNMQAPRAPTAQTIDELIKTRGAEEAIKELAKRLGVLETNPPAPALPASNLPHAYQILVDTLKKSTVSKAELAAMMVTILGMISDLHTLAVEVRNKFDECG